MDGVSLIAAFVAGVASFASPCVLPLVPAYLSLVAGFDVTVGDREHRRFRLLADTLLFVAGFGAVFVVLGLSTSALGHAVLHQHLLLTRIAGVLVASMAVFLVLTLLAPTPGLLREFRTHPLISRFGPFAAPVAGAAFAFGWTPCVGPILASILAVAAQQGHTGDAAVLLVTYTAGLGLPFVVVAFALERVRGPLNWLKRHGTAVTLVSAAGLFGLGLLLILDRLAWIVSLAQRVFS